MMFGEYTVVTLLLIVFLVWFVHKMLKDAPVLAAVISIIIIVVFSWAAYEANSESSTYTVPTTNAYKSLSAKNRGKSRSKNASNSSTTASTGKSSGKKKSSSKSSTIGNPSEYSHAEDYYYDYYDDFYDYEEAEDYYNSHR